MKQNYLAVLFEFVSETINGAERSFLDLLSALVPYAVPVIPAFLTYWHTRNEMNFPVWIAWTAAFVTEVLGITSVSTSIRFWRHNTRYKDPRNQAPFWLAVATYAFYIIVVLSVNVILEIVAHQRTSAVIWAIGLFSLLSLPSAVLISIRTQYGEMLEEKRAQALERKQNMTLRYAKDGPFLRRANGGSVPYAGGISGREITPAETQKSTAQDVADNAPSGGHVRNRRPNK